MSFAKFIVTKHKSNRTSKTSNQNPFKYILTTHKVHSNWIWLFDFYQTKPIVQITTNSAKHNLNITKIKSVLVLWWWMVYVNNVQKLETTHLVLKNG